MKNEDATSLTIYKASAGAGKTFTLSSTYIAHLISDDDDFPHKHQLAVTFTNKATAEMKERIVQYLYSLAMTDDDNDGFFKAVRAIVPESISNKELRRRAKRSLYNIIHDYDHFHVTTIDSFFQSLLSTLAHDLNLSAGFKVEVSDKEILSKAVDRLLANLNEKSVEMDWLTDYIKERIGDDKSWNVADELKTLASQLTKETYMLHSNILKQKENPNLAGSINLDNETVNAYKKELRAIEKEQRELLATYAKEADEAITNKMGYSHISNGDKWVRAYLDKLANTAIHYKDLKEPSASFRSYADGSKVMLKKAELKNNPELEDEANEIIPFLAKVVNHYDSSIAIVNSCQLSLANLNPLRLLDAIDKEVNELNRENDRMLLASTPLLFHNLSADSDASFVFERAGTQYNHIMIDEFQDTSKLQWDNMRKLLVENMAQGNTCMLVGDVKQGIYRFRGGDWNSLAGFQEGPCAELNSYIYIETLKTNFRSGKAVVEFNNRLFTTAPAIVMDSIRTAWGAMEGEAYSPTLDIERIYPTPGEEDKHEVTQLTNANGGFVRIELLNNETEEQKKERKKAEKREKDNEKENYAESANEREASVAEQMIRLHKVGVPYGEMAILIRGSHDADPLMKYFEQNHGPQSKHPIALMSEEAFLLESSSAVMTIINAFKYVANPTDHIALEYLRMQTPDGADFDAIKKILDNWIKDKFGGLPFYEASCRLAEMFALHNRKGQSPYLYYFLDAVLAYIEDHSADVNTFLKYWEETLHRKAIPSAAVDGVRILTIHKSKGLAFHSVFIPYCDWEIEKHPELIWTLPSIAPFNRIPFLPVRMTSQAAISIYRDIYKQETFDKYVENLNLLYVAFTRTKQNLLVWADCNKKGIASILRKALDTQEDVIEYGSPSTLYISKNDNAETEINGNVPERKKNDDFSLKKEAAPLNYQHSPIYIEFDHYDPKLIFRQSNNAEIFLHPTSEEAEVFGGEKAKQEEYRKTGILLHQLMSTIESENDINSQIEKTARQGQLPTTLTIESVSKLITKRIAHPKARAWFDGSWKLYRECSLAFREADENGRFRTVTRRPDRVMMRGNLADGNDETIVIDFKFGKFKTEHREQVKRYMDLLQQQGRHNVKGYLWYLYTGSIEDVL